MGQLSAQQTVPGHTSSREEVLRRVAAGIAALAAGRPALRVALDGPHGAGKGRFARDLDDLLRHLLPPGAEVHRFAADDHMLPQQERRSERAADVEWLYRNSHDFDRIRSIAECRPTDGDDAADVPAGTVVLVAGTALQREELAEVWDLVIYLATPESQAAERTLLRYRAAHVELEDEEVRTIVGLYRDRYLPTYRIYLERAKPAERADVLIDVHNERSPVVVRWGPLAR